MIWSNETEVNVLVPGLVKVNLVPIGDTDVHTFKTDYNIDNYKSEEKGEFEMAIEYGKAVQKCMEDAEDIIIQDYLQSSVPSRSDTSWSVFWEH